MNNNFLKKNILLNEKEYQVLTTGKFLSSTIDKATGIWSLRGDL